MQSGTKHSKRKNPRAKANIISILFFLHLIPQFWRNFRIGLKEENLFDVLEEHRTSALGNKLESIWNRFNKKRKRFALHLSILRMFYKDFIFSGFFQGGKDIIVIIIMPHAVGQLVTFFGENAKISETSAYIYASIIVGSLLFDRVVSHMAWMSLKHLCMKIRVGCCSLVYRKSLRLSLNALNQTNVGHIINLLTNDVLKFDNGLVLFHFMWTSPLQIAVATYILYRVIGISAFSGMVCILLFIPLQLYLGKLNSTIRLRTALRTDERVRLMNEILSGIEIIKIYNWEKPFAKLVEEARKSELDSIRQHYCVESFVFSFETYVTRTAIFITIVVYLVLGNGINADVVYAVTAIYNAIRPVITLLYSVAISYMGECHISVTRLQHFLRLEEIQISKDVEIISKGVDKVPVDKPKIVLENVCAKWSSDSPSNNLTNINLVVDHNQLLCVIGPVGSGKTTLLNTILKEVPYITGKLEVKAKVSYAAQESWLFLGSIRQNILFCNQYDENRYQAVVKACALESDFKSLPFGDGTIVREKGKSLSGGQRARINLARCVYQQADAYLLDDPLSAVDAKVGKKLYEECMKKFLKDKICILVTHQLQYLQTADRIIIFHNGAIEASGTYNELQNTDVDFASLMKKIHTSNKNKELQSRRSTISLDKMDIFWEDDEEKIEDEAVAIGNLGAATYAGYFRKGGNWLVVFSVALVLILNHAAAGGGDYFVSYWINLEEAALSAGNTLEYRDIVIYIYLGITIGTIIFGLAHSTVLFLFLVNASKEMHNAIFVKIVCATMHFFNHNPTGRILNRFSNDIGIVDEYIPYVLMDIADVALMLAASLVLSCVINPWFALPSVALLLLLYLIRNVYIRTSRQVKRIEGAARSPLYNHTAASVNGLTTIRAFKSQQILINEYDSIQDDHNSAWYLYISASEAFGLWIDLICLLFVGVIIFSFLLINTGYNGGQVGLLVTLYVGLTGIVQWGIFQWSELENNMTSVERILEYSRLETEPQRPPIPLPKDWPEFGKIVFDNVSMKYEPHHPPALANLNFVVNAGEKVGIVGRTGAGKSSIIAALFQFYPLEGTIIVDGVDTTKVPLDVLRSKMSIIPQECVLFSGTMRKNLDPFEEYNDEILWHALEQVEIKTYIERMPGGLNAPISESGANFSVGQRQLICLARAIVRNNRIIVMDEATANIDSQTDQLIQKAIKQNFASCTILTVAHRLNTIMDSDKILVMDKGHLVEYDSPFMLLQNERGIFHSMVQNTGTGASKHLLAVAKASQKTKSKK